MFVPVEVTNETVDSITPQLLGEVGPGGTDLVSLQQWLLQFGAASAVPHQIIGVLGTGCPIDTQPGRSTGR